MHDPETLGGLADAHVRQGRYEQALLHYSQALALAPDHPGLLNNRGAALEKLGRLDEALASYERAQAQMPRHSGIINNIGVVLMKLRRLDDALTWFDRAIGLDPQYAVAFNNRGNVLSKLRRFKEALVSYDRAVALRPGHSTSLVNRAFIFQELKRFGVAGAAFADVLCRDPTFPAIHQHVLNNRLRCCDWTDHATLAADVIHRIEGGEAPVDPLYLLAIADRTLTQCAAARTFAAPYRALVPQTLPAPRTGDRIHLAYVCVDFGTRHATWYLTEGLIKSHDRARFKTTGVSLGPMSDATARSHFDEWIDATQCSDVEVVRLLRRRNVNIAVDLQGYSGPNRPAIFAYRAAPIQVSWLAFPGTMGMDCIDYIVADRHIVPPGDEGFYTENVIRLPDTYQANNHRHLPIGQPTGRTENGLPESGFVFCCFNNNFKITPAIFDVWMRLLRDIEGSVLWLLGDNDDAIANLRREARQRGVAATRLVFAGRVDGGTHLARHGCADLFLDTLPCNAHTTTTDALWAGLPVLTCSGATFAARVAGSLLHAAGLPELVTTNLVDYERMARQLATEPSALRRLKEKLRASRPTCRLFDIDRFRQNLEAAYAIAHQRHQRGLPPESFSV